MNKMATFKGIYCIIVEICVKINVSLEPHTSQFPIFSHTRVLYMYTLLL